MKIVEDKIYCFFVDKNNHLSIVPLRSQIGKSEDNFVTLSIELKDKTIMTMRLGEIMKLANKAGVKC